MKKHELRTIGKQKILDLDKEQKLEISRKLSKNLKTFLESLNSETDLLANKMLGGFAPLKDELDWYLEIQESGMWPCVPCLVDEINMEFYKVSWKLLTKDFLSVNWAGRFPKALPKVLLVPGLMFDPKGGRLGRGKGCYDKYLSNKEVLKIGVCSEEQIIKELTLEDHDIRMDVVITDQNIYRRG